MSKKAKIHRKDGTLECIYPTEDGKKTQKVPINRLTSIETYGNISFSIPLLLLCNNLEIPCYFNSYYGRSIGRFIPANQKSSIVKLKQYDSFQDKKRKTHIAQSIITKSSINRLKIIHKFDNKKKCQKEFNKIIKLIKGLRRIKIVNKLRGIEGNIMKEYFSAFRKMLYHLPFNNRSTQPPKDEGNAILSFGNVILYNKVDSIVYRCSLDPQVGFLHEPHENRSSLSLDISEIFRPLLVDNLILRLDHKNTLRKNHFKRDEFKCYLNKRGKEIWLKEWKNHLKSSFKYNPLNRKISIQETIKIECYNLIKYFNQEKQKYNPLYFKIRW
ncbi:MAG: CRISPR-associated endonuclease Cas1 [Atribacterota bacterium]